MERESHRQLSYVIVSREISVHGKSKEELQVAVPEVWSGSQRRKPLPVLKRAG